MGYSRQALDRVVRAIESYGKRTTPPTHPTTILLVTTRYRVSNTNICMFRQEQRSRDRCVPKCTERLVARLTDGCSDNLDGSREPPSHLDQTNERWVRSCENHLTGSPTTPIPLSTFASKKPTSLDSILGCW